MTDIEVFIVLDGPTPATREAAIGLQDADERVRLFDNPKGARHGELHRHEALRHATGKIVCYLSDDDLWLPDHIAGALTMLSDADFAHSLPTWVTTEGGFGVWSIDLTSEFYRDMLLGGLNRIPLSTGAHTLDLYRRLPHGWRTTPEETPTDLYMWQQILEMENVRTVSGTTPSALSFPTPERRHMTEDERLAELQTWEKRWSEPPGRAAARTEILDLVVLDRAQLHATLQKDARYFQASLVEAEDKAFRATQQITELSTRNDELVAAHDADQRQIEAARLEREQLIDARSKADRQIEAARLEREQLVDARSKVERQLRAVRSSATWRLRGSLIRVPGLGRAYKWIARRV